MFARWLSLSMVVGGVVACSSSSSDPSGAASATDAGAVDLGGDGDGGSDAGGPSVRADRFATKVVSFTPGACAGFGAAKMPDVVLGPPKGAPGGQGGTDVVSLGTGGEIVLSFEPNAVVDGPGTDLLVFENAFVVSGTSQVYAEPAEVSVSDDGVTWSTFPCTATEPPWGSCAGWHPVTQAGPNVSPVDPAEAGGDPFDLADLGVTRARFVRIRDKGHQDCAAGQTTNGFDLDAIAAVNAAEM